jgi:CubicO group peptidase (beta-lactamase class C family)
MLHATYTDACVVVHDGAIVFEYYDEGVRPTDAHLLMSVSKSLTASLIGVLVGQGTLTTDGLVTQYLPTLAGTVWEGCTVQHLLDMRGGVVFSEHDMDDPEADGCLLEQVSGYTTHRRRDLPANTYDWIRSLPAQGVHGGQFEYRSILIDVLAWIAEEVTGERFADLFSRLIWGRIGAECDADLIVDSAGFPVVEGGFSATARDMARFGLMHLQRGVADGRRVLPAEWVDRVVTRDQDLIDTFATSYEGDSSSPELYYHDCWWGWDAALGRYGGYGLGGQNVLIDRTSNTVIVKLSSWPKRMDPLLAKFGDAVNEALFDSLKNP